MRVLSALTASFLTSLLAAQPIAQGSSAPPMPPEWITSFVTWELPQAHFVKAKMPMTLVHPRPDSETPAWARHRKAYPGIEYLIPVTAQGGAYPFGYEILSGPSWLSIGATVWDENYGVLHGTPPTDEDGKLARTVKIRIYGQEYGRETSDTVGPTYADVEFSIRVTSSTDDFIFVDESVVDSGDGSIGSPIKTLGETYLTPSGLRSNSATYPRRAVYLRAGEYQSAPKVWANNGKISLDPNLHPMVFLAFPGDARPIVRFNNAQWAIRSDVFIGELGLYDSPSQVKNSANTHPGQPNMFSGLGDRGTFFRNEMIGARSPWFEYTPYTEAGYQYVSATQFRVPGVDATVHFPKMSHSLGSQPNRIRIYSASGNEQPDGTGHFWQGAVAENATFDGTDTYVTVTGAGVPVDISNVRVTYLGGNVGFLYTSGSAAFRKHWTFWENTLSKVEDLGVSGGGAKGFGSIYSMSHSVFEGNLYAPDAANRGAFIDTKSSVAWASYRRNVSVGLNGRVFRHEGAVVGAFSHQQASMPENGWPAEFCYNVFIRPGSDGELWEPQSRSNDDRGVAELFVYRNTIVGRTKLVVGSDHNTAHIEGNLKFTNTTRWPSVEKVTVVNDEGGSYADWTKWLDREGKLKNEFRTQYLGTHGAEMHRAIN